MILITRNQDQSLDLEQKLTAKGFKTTIFPLFEIVQNKVKILDQIYYKLFQPKTILITSSNAIFYLEKLKITKEVAIFAVGKETANKLNQLGYKNINIANNSADSLLRLAQKIKDKKKLILYLCGEITTKDLALELRKKGFYSKKITCYQIKERNHLSSDIIDKIKNGKISATTIYSKNTLRIFHQLLIQHNLLEYYTKIKLLCLSDDIIDAAREAGFPRSENINKILNIKP